MILKLITLFFVPFVLFAQISEISSIREAEPFFADADESTLVVFDIDDTLLIPVEPAFQERNRKKHLDLHNEIFKDLTIEQLDLIGNLKLLISQGQLIEAHTPAFIQDLQAKNVPIIALTAVMGQSVDEQYMPESRCQELKRNGYDFSQAFPVDHLILDNMKTCFGSYPVYYKGVLCSNGDLKTPGASSKGAVLCEFLQRMNHTPKKIIFVDDREYNLVAMEKAINEKYPDIVFIGLRYSGSDHFPSPSISQSDYEAAWENVIQKAEESMGDLYNLSPLVQFLTDAAKEHRHIPSKAIPIFAIGGSPGVGKTYLSQILVKRLQERDIACSTLPLDHFNLSTEERKKIGTQWDIRHLKVDELHRVLSAISNGEKILEKPTCNQMTGETGLEKIDLSEQDLVLFEGIYGLCTRAPLNFFDYCFAGVYLKADEFDIRMWKWQREQKKLRPRTPEQFDLHMEAIMQDFHQNISYSEMNALFILNKNSLHGYRLHKRELRQAA